MKSKQPDAPGPRPHGNTRERILEAAQRLTQTESYDGFSFRDLAAVVGIRKASIYHHFESKEALAKAMIERAQERFARWAGSQSARSPDERLAAYCFELYGKLLGAGKGLCPGGALVSGWSHLSDEVHTAVAALLDAHIDFLQSALGDGARTGCFALPANQSLAATARWFASTVQGALIWSRATDGYSAFEEICDTTLASLHASRTNA
jgi:TetR/AcrR family transcriptional regulator, transcriptional repressor for nem operon